MNYRHIYHAGNFADVMKHLALTLVLDHLRKKDSGFCVIDAHGGCGKYDLSSEEAMKTREWGAGIGSFSNREDEPEDFKAYYDLVEPDLLRGFYPGSPMIAQKLLRPQDRLIANELHPEDVETLRTNLGRRDSVRVTHLDAYECIRANIPPKEKRGVVLIDPPFEKKDEFETLARQMAEWKKRFANGIFMVWYPIKAHLEVDLMKAAAKDLQMPRTWCAETLLHPRDRAESFNGCGLLIFNAPFQVPERMQAVLPFLKKRMGLYDTPTSWLVRD